MQKTKIEWCDYTVNPVKGLCPMACPYCYARAMYKRFKWNETIRYDAGVWDELRRAKKPSRVFVGSTMELFGPWATSCNAPAMEAILDEIITSYPQHTFIFLTKRPLELAKYNPWPDNCWVGASVTNADQQSLAYLGLGQTAARVKFISYEPLLTNVYMKAQFLDDAGINWIIIGQQTPIREDIPASWISSLELEANRSHIPVFEKNNLVRPLLGELRQEFPGG